MILAVAATEFEMRSLKRSKPDSFYRDMVCGVGPVESCLQLTRYLNVKANEVSMVVNFGIAGAYISAESRQLPSLLDICLADTEVLGDLGLCFPRRLDDLPGDLVHKTFVLDADLRKAAEQSLQQNNIDYHLGHFVTVSCVSGTRERGILLQRKYRAICENMEGAALARVCLAFSLPLLQIRCISNMVDNRDPKRWKLVEAAEKCGQTTAFLIEQLG